VGVEDDAKPRRGVELDDDLVRLRLATAREAEAGRALEDEAQLRLGDREPLAGADEERHPGPAPVLDVEAKRGIRLRRGVGSDAVDRAVAVVLAAHVCPGSAGSTEWKSASTEFLIVSESGREGTSIADAATTCMRWLTTTSRSAPTGS
jgi:hypothetical protein